jgi:hypothetical protein
MFSLHVESVNFEPIFYAVSLTLMLVLVPSTRTLPLCHLLDTFAMFHPTALNIMNLKRMSQLSPVPQCTLAKKAGRLTFLLSMKVCGPFADFGAVLLDVGTIIVKSTAPNVSCCDRVEELLRST